MEGQSKEEKEYQERFNAGYTIAKHLPDLANQLHKSVGQAERSQGFRDGIEQFNHDKERENYPSWLRENNKDKTHSQANRDKDRDMEKE